MDRLTQPLRYEHRELRPHVDDILAAADLLDERAPELPVERLAASSAFLRDHLLRHASAEEAVLYPMVGLAFGDPGATATMARDHRQIEHLGEELAGLVANAGSGGPDVRALRRVLYGLHAILVLHFAKEEEVYLPLLDARLTPDEATRLFAGMEEAAAIAA